MMKKNEPEGEGNTLMSGHMGECKEEESQHLDCWENTEALD